MDPEDNMMRCEKLRDQVEAYIDDDLDTNAHATMKSHLIHCPACQSEVEAARRIKSALNAMPSLTCPDRVVESARFRIEKPTPKRRSRALPGWAHYGLAAATVLLAAMGFVFWPTSEAPPTNTTVATPDTSSPQPSAEALRIAQAEAQIKWTLAYIGRINQRSAEAARARLAPVEMYGPTSRTLSALFGSKNAGAAKEI